MSIKQLRDALIVIVKQELDELAENPTANTKVKELPEELMLRVTMAFSDHLLGLLEELGLLPTEDEPGEYHV